MKEISISVNGTRYKAKKLDDEFADFVRDHLKEAGMMFDRDNDAEKLFLAYLRLAGRYYNYEKEIDEIIEEIESPSA
jgi:selenocysteine lyase/cysteine desulfurase